MSRPTDFERGARRAFYEADLRCIQRELFPHTDADALDALWISIRDAAGDALREAVTCRQQAAA